MRQENRDYEPVIYLVGIGMGGEDQLTLAGERAIAQADAVAGAKRMLKSVENLILGKRVLDCYDADEIEVWLDEQRDEIQTGAVLFSGDTGFYSGAGKVKERLKQAGWQVAVIPGISSISYCAARMGVDWQDAEIVSLHGRNEDYIRRIGEHGKCFFLLGGQITPKLLCQKLQEKGLSDCFLSFGSNLSYDNERLVCGTAKELAENRIAELESLGRLVCCFTENPRPKKQFEGGKIAGFSLKDSDFIRGRVPMTKEEIRSIVLAKLKLQKGSCLYDIGAGTGSVAVAAAMLLGTMSSQVFAVEKNPEGLELIEKNRQALIPEEKGFFVVAGEAPEALDKLPAPTHGFIGGSGGKLTSIAEALLIKNQKTRIVITAITLETLAECLEIMKEWEFEETEIIQAGVSETVSAGPYHMQKGRNPIYIVTLAGCRGKKEIEKL